MNNDEFDEMLKTRYKAFIADLTAVLPPSRLPVESPARSRMPRWSAAIRSRVAFLKELSVRAMVPTAFMMAIAVAFLVAGVFLLAQDRRNDIGAAPAQQFVTTPPVTGPSEVTGPSAERSPAETQYREERATTTTPPPRRPAAASAVPLVPTPNSTTSTPLDDLRLLFAADSVTLQENDVSILRTLAYRWEPGERISIVGHTARLGDADGALALSRRRADVVREELIEAGVPATAITAAGAGYADAAGVVDPQDRRVVVKRVTVAS